MFLLIFFCGFSAKRNISCNYRNKHFSSQKQTKISSTGFIRLRFQCYNCKSGIVIFSWVAVSVQLGGGRCHWFVLRQLDTLERVSTIGTLIAIGAFSGEVSALTSTEWWLIVCLYHTGYTVPLITSKSYFLIPISMTIRSDKLIVWNMKGRIHQDKKIRN